MLNFNCPGSISWFHSYAGGKWGESRQGGDSLGHLSGTMGKSGKTLDKFSVQISNEKEQRKLRKAAPSQHKEVSEDSQSLSVAL